MVTFRTVIITFVQILLIDGISGLLKVSRIFFFCFKLHMSATGILRRKCSGGKLTKNEVIEVTFYVRQVKAKLGFGSGLKCY